ncbi:MAG: alpha/beta hydrolase [Prevotellaceae bacterium]|nr:alpha/beta hydrolase [Prevotellaceae bacterium]
MKKKVMKRIGGIALTVALLLAAATAAGGFYMLDYSLRPGTNDGRDVAASYRYMFDEYPYIQPWVDSLQTAGALRDTFIVNPDGIRLHALYAAAAQPTRRTAVIVHGYTDSSVRMLMIGYLYHRALGYNILLPDLQHCGLSGGSAIQMGWKDRLDVLRWMEVANALYGGETQMVVHGISMGAATTMCVSGEPQPPYVKCFVEDCGYTSVWAQFAKELKEQFGLPPFPLLHAATTLCKLRYGWSFGEASPLKQVAKCSLPMLFIHGSADTYVPTQMVYPLYEAKPEPKAMWVVPGAAHAVSYKENREEYTRRVHRFVEQYIH